MPGPEFQCSLDAGVRHFNRQEFYEAHEVWEDRWHEEKGPEKAFLQGLIQAAVAFYKLQSGNPRGLHKMLLKSVRNLRPFGPESHGVRLDRLLADLERWDESARSMARTGRHDFAPESLPRILSTPVQKATSQ
ncbi:MAG: DUF309 domain-containing protein [Planctomycetes bacterium]|nr:DUF309 domain-containing protein [Planctomycetota bacterium]